MKTRNLTLCILLAAFCFEAEAQEERAQATTTRAHLEQEILPALAARKQRAQTRIQAAQEYFSKAGSWEEAFPELAFAPLDELSYLQNQQRRLAETAVEREAARISKAPFSQGDALDTSELERWRREMLATYTAEEQADQLKSRFLRGLEAGLQLAPGLRREFLLPLETHWATLRQQEEPSNPDDPEGQRALQRANEAGDATALAGRYQRAAWRAMTRPGDDALSILVAEDVAALENSPLPDPESDGGVLTQARRDLLERASPLLEEPLRGQVEFTTQGHRRRRAEARLPALRQLIADLEELETASPPQANEKNLESLEAELEEINAARDKWQALLTRRTFATDPEVASLEEERATLEVRYWTLRSEMTRRILERGQRLVAAGLHPLQAAATTRAQSEEAQRKAEEARREAEEEAQPLKREVAELRTRIAEILEEETERHERALHDLEIFQQGLEDRRQEHLAILALSPLADQRSQRIDTVYLANHSAVADLRRWLATERSASAAAKDEDEKRFSTLAEELPNGSVSAELLTEWSAARGEYFNALATQKRNQFAEQDSAWKMLAASQRNRRALRKMASPPVRLQVQRDFTQDLKEEVQEIPEILARHRRNLTNTSLRMPLLLSDFNLLQSLFMKGTGLLFLLWLWWATRSSSRNWLNLGLRSWARRGQVAHNRGGGLGWQTDPAALPALATSATPALRRLVDLGALCALYFGFVRPLPLLALPVLLLSLWALYRLVPDTVELAIAIPGERRPGLLITSLETRRRAVSSARWLCGALLGYVVLLAIVRDVLEGDRLSQVMARLATVLFLLLVATLLLTWYPILRRHAATHLPAGRLQRWFDAEQVSVFGRLLRSACGILILLTLAGAHLADRYGNYEWLETFIARRKLQQARSVKSPLQHDVRQAIQKGASPWVPPKEETNQLLETFSGWQRDQRRGLVVVIGGRGMGKTTFLERIPSLLQLNSKEPQAAYLDPAKEKEEKPPLAVVRLQIGQRLVGAAAGRLWLARALGMVDDKHDEGSTHATPSREEIVEFLLLRSPSLFLIDELQYLLLRTVGGFAALREVLAILHRTSSHHFWVVACHGSSWSYLAGVAIDFPLEVFRQRITLAPWKAESLAQWLEEGTRNAGFEPRFETLIPSRGGRKPGYRLDRARDAFWRLLGETSRGNPGVAMIHWLDSLCRARDQADQDQTTTVDVTLVNGPTSEQVEALPGNDLFVLTALVLHSRMNPEHLEESLNLPRGPLEVTCRHLEGLGVIERLEDGDLAVSSRWYPAVVRVLRQKHFLHRS